MRVLKLLLAGVAFTLCAQAQAQVKLTFWSHWAAEKIKRDYVEDAIKRFEAANPGVKIEAHVVREDRALRGPQDRAARRHRRRTSSTPSPTRSSTWRTGCCSTSRR